MSNWYPVRNSGIYFITRIAFPSDILVTEMSLSKFLLPFSKFVVYLNLLHTTKSKWLFKVNKWFLFCSHSIYIHNLLSLKFKKIYNKLKSDNEKLRS